MVKIIFKKDDGKTFSTRRLVGTLCMIFSSLLSIVFFIVCMIHDNWDWSFKIIIVWAFIGVGLLLGAKIMDKFFNKVVDKL